MEFIGERQREEHGPTLSNVEKTRLANAVWEWDSHTMVDTNLGKVNIGYSNNWKDILKSNFRHYGQMKKQRWEESEKRRKAGSHPVGRRPNPPAAVSRPLFFFRGSSESCSNPGQGPKGPIPLTNINPNVLHYSSHYTTLIVLQLQCLVLLQLQLQHYITLHWLHQITSHYSTLHYRRLQLQLHYITQHRATLIQYTTTTAATIQHRSTLQLQLHCTTTITTAALYTTHPHYIQQWSVRWPLASPLPYLWNFRHGLVQFCGPSRSFIGPIPI